MQTDATDRNHGAPPFIPTLRNDLAALLTVATLLYAAQSGTGIAGARSAVLSEYSWWLANLPNAQ